MDKQVRMIKRAMDLSGSILALLAGAPAFTLIAAAIKLQDGGPVFSRRIRAGAHHGGDPGRADCTFDLLTFRVSSRQASAIETTGPERQAERPLTRLGALLRRTRLEELPQLLNVLSGEMSLVGPRPAPPQVARELATAIPFFAERMREVRPGLTGLAQVDRAYLGGLSATDLTDLRWTGDSGDEVQAGATWADERRTQFLLDYVYAASLERVSSFLRIDLTILLRTPLRLLSG